MPSSSKRRVKIVCTLGPATHSPERIAALIDAGMDVARLNFSHGTHEFHRETIQTIRQAAHKAGKPIAILQDLQGPKIRIGVLPKGGLDLKAGDVLLLHPEGETPKLSTHGKIPVPVTNEIAHALAKDVQVGARILFDDGKIISRTREVSPPEIVVEVENGGKLTDHKGMNLPGTSLSIPCMTDKDYEDLRFGLSEGVDAVALSFVRSSDDIEDLKQRIRGTTNELPLIVAKMEREEAVEDQQSIIEVADGLMIARGDMAVELGAERVPSIQKEMIRQCNELGVPVITATQMLESMISCPTPTRAEASDVANAVFDGTDAVMLSAETAAGQYPIEAVQTMSRIALAAERSRSHFCRNPANVPMAGMLLESIEFSASRIAHHMGASAIICLTHTGTSVRALAKFRPDKPILAVLDDESVLRRLSFVWGVQGVVIPTLVATDDLFAVLEKVVLDNGFAEPEDLIVVTAGIPTLKRGTTNMIKVHRVGAHHKQSPQK